MSFLKKLNNFNPSRRFISNDRNRFLKFGLDIDGAKDDSIGTSVSMGDNNNNFLAIGGYGKNSFTGVVRVYSWNGSVWSQLGSDLDGEAADDEFGRSVCLRTTAANPNNPIVAIGAPYNRSGLGHVRIWRWSSGWSRYGGANDIDGDGNSGFSVTLNKAATRLFVGRPYNSDIAFESGAYSAYNVTLSSTTLINTPKSGTAGALFGYSISTSDSNNLIVIGAPGANFARLSSWSSSTVGSSPTFVTDFTGASGDFFGGSVAINGYGDTVIVGAKDYNSSTGYVKIYRDNGVSWVQLGQTIFGDKAWDYFGRSVSIDKAGTKIIVGGSNFVKIYFYEGSVWKLKGGQINGKIIGEPSGNNFGGSVSMHADGNIFAIGDDEDNPPNKSAAGSVRTYYDYNNLPSSVNTEDISSI